MYKFIIHTLIFIVATMTAYPQSGDYYCAVTSVMCGKTTTGGFNNSNNMLLSFTDDSVGVLEYTIEFTQDDHQHQFSGHHSGWKYYRWKRNANTIVIQGRDHLRFTIPKGKDYELVLENQEHPIIFLKKFHPQPADDAANRSYQFSKNNKSMLLTFTSDSLLIQHFESTGDKNKPDSATKLISSEIYTWLAIDEIILLFGDGK